MFQKTHKSASRFGGRGPGRRGQVPGDKRRPNQDGERGAGGPGGPRFFRKKTCRFCSEGTSYVDFKESEKLTRFLTEKGKVIPRRITGNCAKHQRMLARAIKRARHAALIAFQFE